MDQVTTADRCEKHPGYSTKPFCPRCRTEDELRRSTQGYWLCCGSKDPYHHADGCRETDTSKMARLYGTAEEHIARHKQQSPIERAMKAGILEPEPRRITFLCQVPAGTQLIAVGDTIIAVAPGMEASYVTPDGLVPIMTAAERRECSSNPQKSSN